MQIAILGTVAVGPALGKALRAAGHEVTIGTRDPDQTKAREQWAGVDLPLAAYEDLDADVFINATNGAGSLPALQAVGNALSGRVVIDTSNPLDFSHGFPPSLFISNTDSLAEQLQRELPEARLVKMFNTMANEVMVNPRGLRGDSTIFVAGNDPAARLTAASLAADLGWADVFDLGDLTAARGLEMYLPLWVRIFSLLGRPDFKALWVLGPRASYGQLVAGAEITAAGLADGSYRLEWFDDATGSLVEQSRGAARGGEIRIAVPAFRRHLAAKLTRID